MTDTQRLDWVLATRAAVLTDADGITLSFSRAGITRTMPSNDHDARALIDRAMQRFPMPEGA